MASGPNLFQIRRTAVAGRAANTQTLPNPGELAINMTDQILYSTNGEVVFEIGANVDNQVVRSTLLVGNTTVNIFANSTIIKLSNSTVNTHISVPTAAQYAGAYYLHANGDWATVTAEAAASGANTEIQYNLSGALAGDSDFTYDQATTKLTIGNTTVNVTANSMQIKLSNSTVNTYLSVPTSVQYSATNYFLHANGSWVQVTSGDPSVYVYQKFTATGGQTEFTISGGYTADEISVYENGVHLANDEYTANGTTVVLGTGALAGAIIEVVGYIALSTFTPVASGSNTQVQFNDSGSPGGTSGFTFDKATNNALIANTLTIGTATINSTNYSQTANNANYLGGTAAADYQTEAGLAANVATMTANNANYLGGTAAADYQTEAGLAANVAVLTANNANYLGGTAAADYQTEAGLAANVAVLTANNANYLGGTAAADYQTEAGLAANVATMDANNAAYLGGLAAASWANLSVATFTTSVNVGANVQANLTTIRVGNSTVNTTIGNNVIFVGNTSSNITINSIAVVLNTVLVANALGVYHTGVMNAATISAGATLTANSTLVNAAAINVTGQINTATFYATTTANVGSVQVNTTALAVGSSIVNGAVIYSAGSLLSANVQINPQTGTTYTLQASDSGKIVTMDNGSAMTVTVPAGLPIGFRCQVLRLGAGTCTLSNTGQTGCTILSRTSAFAVTARYGSASVFQTATANTYIVDGLI